MPGNVGRLGLAGWLALTTGLLVVITVAAVSAAGVRLLRGLADTEAKARVELAAATAREALRQSGDDLLTATLILAERPTLLRLLEREELSGLEPYLARYCDGAALDACAVGNDDTLLAAAGADLDWARVRAAAAEQGQRFLVSGALEGTALAGSVAELSEQEGITIFGLRRLDDEFAARLSERVGMDVQILDFVSLRQGEGPLAVLISDALSSAGPVTARVRALDSYASVIPIAAASGETVALLRTVLPAESVRGVVLAMERRMLVIGAVVALLATALAVLIGRYWTSGIRELTAAARRIGRGDLTVSVANAGSAEIGLLASTMEEMRKNLIELTREIRRREAQAQAVLGGIVEGVYAVDKKRRIRYLNRQAEELLGVSAEHALGRFCGDVLKPKPDSDGRLPCAHSCPIVAAREGNSVEAVELIEPQPERRRRVVIASAPSGDGMQVQVLRDETEMEAVRRTRDTVLANISHEFRTPLSAQLASIELLREGLGKLPLAAQSELVSSLERGVHRLTWLIDNLLESVRIESGQLTIRHQSVSIDEVAEAARELIEPLLTQRGQRLDLDTLTELAPVQGDRQRLIQVMVNLLANASKFSPPDGVIRVGGDMPDSETVVFWVEDEGPGPADPADTALFDRFHRSGGEDPEESGLGLGLYIVRSIIERHGGEVALIRTPEGRTRAAATLPVGQAA